MLTNPPIGAAAFETTHPCEMPVRLLSYFATKGRANARGETMRGFYKMEYTGKDGQGAGAVTFVDGKLAGIDVGGGVYRGEFQTTQDGVVTGYADLTFPAGGILVTGTSVPPGSPPIRIPFSINEDQASGKVLRIETPTGPVNLRLSLISAL